MTKKKKTLRAAVLASIFAMAFSATAWGSNYNPNLTDENGAGTGEGANYHFANNYFMQYHEYINTDENHSNRWDRIIGVYMDENSKTVNNVNGDTITVNGVQLKHVTYNSDGTSQGVDGVSKDGMSIGNGHYCGESAQSVSIGQLQRMNEVYYGNDVALQTAIVNEATTRANADIALDDRLDAIEAGYVKSVVDKGNNTWTVTHNNGSEVEIKNTTYNVVEAGGSGSTINTYTIKGNNGDDAGEIVDTNKYVTAISHNDINVPGDGYGKLTTTLTFNDTTSLKTTAIDIGKYVKDNAGDSWFDVDKQITLEQAIKAAKTTVEAGKNIDVTGSINDDGSIKYTVSTKDDVNFNIVTTKTLNVTDTANIKSAKIKELETLEANIKIAKIGTLEAVDAHITNAEIKTLKAEVANIKTTNTEVINLGTKEGGTDIRYDVDDDRITYNNGMEKIANLSDGMKYGADSGDELKLELNEKLNVNGDNNITTVATAATENTPAQIQVKLNNDITVNSVTANSVYSNYVEAKVVNAEKVLSDYVEANRINAGVVDTDKVFSQYVETEIVNTDKIFSEYGEIKLVNSKTVSAETLTLRGKTKNTDVTFNGVADGNDGAKGRIEYKDTTGANQQVANLNDYITYTADKVAGNSTNTSAEVKLRESLAIKGDKNLTTFVNPESKEVQVTLNDKLVGLEEVNSTTVNTQDINVSNVVTVGDNVTINNNGLTIEGVTTKVVINETKVDVGGNKIENVASGELSPDSQDAVNGSQLFNTNQKLDRLGNRVDKVGAGAAALAALHPLDFDPDDKLSFSAGVGNYGGETASALGMFYRPTEKVMLSAAGTMGNGENMVNMGVTFALDRKNNVSNSRVAMAREIQDLREQVATLTALVTQLAGRNNPALMDAVMFPDVPENHWAYDYIEGLQKRGIVEGYPDGNFGGDRSMTRYEYAAMLYRALEKGFPVDSRLLDEFDAELGRIRIDRIKGLDDDDNKIERVRVNQYEDRDDYGSKLTTVNEAE